MQVFFFFFFWGIWVDSTPSRTKVVLRSVIFSTPKSGKNYTQSDTKCTPTAHLNVLGSVSIIYSTSCISDRQDLKMHSLTLTPTPPFSFLDYLLGKGGVQKWGFPAWVLNCGPPAPNALCIHGTPLGCHCPGSDFVPIWDPLLWRNRT